MISGRDVGKGLMGLLAGSGYGDLRPHPKEPIAGMIAWYDAADTSTFLITSSAVEQWDDKSGGGNHLTQAVSGSRPRYTSDQINGIVCPYFDGSDDYMVASSVSRGDRTCTWFHVGTLAGSGAIRPLAGANGDGGNLFRTDSSRQLQTVKQFVVNLFNSTVTVPLNAPFVAVQVLSATSVRHILNDDDDQSTSDSTTFTGRHLLLGCDPNGGNYWFGMMAEVIGYDYTLSDAEITHNIAYLMEKWGIT
ncbi:MAG: hypothetical protein KatS3mg015_2548 [Fimbriimonadales bacterium]|nr:MAG: hypothetical protein KatS3mg015_2548 [Fimbriimonadales bacterium]